MISKHKRVDDQVMIILYTVFNNFVFYYFIIAEMDYGQGKDFLLFPKVKIRQSLAVHLLNQFVTQR